MKGLTHITLVLLISNGPVALCQVSGPIGSAATPSQPESRISAVYQALFASHFYSNGYPQPFSDASWESWPDSRVSQAVVSFFFSIGLEEKSARDLYVYVRDGLAEQGLRSRQKLIEFCNGRGAITSKRQVSDAFNAIAEEMGHIQDRLWGTFHILDAKSRRILHNYAVQSSKQFEIYPADAREIFEKSPETVGQLLARICDPP